MFEEGKAEERHTLESIGNILKNERDKRGVSLVEAHEATKITQQNLAALEDDRFEIFPNRVYARAFLRDYANYLGLDSGALLERYEFEWGPKPERETASRKSRVPVAVVAIVLVVLAAIAAAYYAPEAGKPGKPARPTTMAHKTEKPKQKPKPKPAPKPVSTPAEPAVTSESNAGVNPDQVKELKLQVSGVGVSWMRVQIDQNPPTEFMVNAGDVKSFVAKDKFIVRVGRPGGITLHLNGRRLPQLGPAGVAVTKEVDRTWLKPAANTVTTQPQPADGPAPEAPKPQ